jgi:5'-deoxynucleotidase YfbR-like HD superfamily hydrolase
MLEAMLDHDAAETILGDTPYTAKTSFPRLKDMVSSLERIVGEEHGFSACLTEQQKLWVKLADLLEMALFGVEQCELGNIHGRKVVKTVMEEIEAHPYRGKESVQNIVVDIKTRLFYANEGR